MTSGTMESTASVGDSTETQTPPASARTARVKLVPPRLPSRFVRRGELERRLDQAATRRVTAVVAAAGFGKSTHLAARALANEWCWYTVDGDDAAPSVLAEGLADALRRQLSDLGDAHVPTATAVDERAAADSLAAVLSRMLEDRLSEDIVLVIDDVHELGRDAPSVRLLESLARYAPAELHLVFSSRDEIPFSVSRLRGQGNVLDFDGSDFAFGPAEVACALAAALGPDGGELAPRVHDITGGWPVAVQLAVEMLASALPEERKAALDALSTRRGPLFGYLAEEIFAREPSEVRSLLRVIAHFDRVTPDLCTALGLANAEGVLIDLARRGLVAEGDSTYVPHMLVRQFVTANWPLAPTEIREVRRLAGKWFEATNDAIAATKAYTAAGDHESIARVWRAEWLQLDNAAAVEPILEGAALLPQSEREYFAGIITHALIIRGEMEQARQFLATLTAARSSHALFLDGLAHMHRSEHREALEKLMKKRTRHPEDIDPYVSCFTGYQLIALGRAEEARPLLDEALENVAEDNPGGLAEAQLLASDLARVDGDLNAALAAAGWSAKRYAELGNVLGQCSAQNRLVVLHALLGSYEQAREVSATAARLSEHIGFSQFQTWAADARGFLHLTSGRLDEAANDFAFSTAANEQLGSNEVAVSLNGLGDLHRERGERALARSAYERALTAAERSGCVATQVLAKAGLARLLVDDDPDQAASLADTAVRTAPGLLERIDALLARGWVAACSGHARVAADAAAEAQAAAGKTASPGLLAQTLELAAFAADDARNRAELLQEALEIRNRLGNTLAASITTLALAASEPTAVATDDLAHAEQALREAGVRRRRAAAGILALLPTPAIAPLAVETLGRFAVLHEGVTVTPAQWQSKKARDLLKILVTRRGQATPRDYLMELLWPDDDPARTSKRLAVAANVLRNVLDPGRRYEGDHFVIGGPEGFRLNLEHVAVDVEDFLSLAAEGLQANRDESDQATSLLRMAESAYAGEFLPEDRYEDWAAPLRDEVRTTYLELVRALAAQANDHAAKVRYLLRVLAHDRFDEDAHLSMVAAFRGAGMHGEARRAYRRYVERMDEIGIEPAAYEQVAAPP